MTTETQLTPAPSPIPARVVIQAGGDKYSCETPDRNKAMEFISWFLYDVRGTAVVDIRYDQREPLPAPVPAADGAKK